MDEKEFEFENDFGDESNDPEWQAFKEQFYALVDEEVHREKTLVVNPIVMQNVYFALNLIRKIDWGEPAIVKMKTEITDITRSVRILVTCLGKTFNGKHKDELIKLIQLSNEVDISGANSEGMITIDFDFEDYLIEVPQT